MKALKNYILEDKVTEFNYASEGDHNFIDEVIELLESNGFNKSEKKILKPKEYKITNNGYELFARSEQNKTVKNTKLVCIRKGDNDKYDYYYKYSNDSFWIFKFSKNKEIFRFRDYQHSDNGVYDVNDQKWHDRLLQSIRGIFNIKKDK